MSSRHQHSCHFIPLFVLINTGHYPLELFELGVLEVPQGARVFLLDVTQTRVADLGTHFPDVHQCWSEALWDTKMVKICFLNGGFLSIKSCHT